MITEKEIEKLSGIMSKLGEAHNMLAKTSLSKEEYQPISGLLASAKVELFNFYNEHKAALQNKVSEKCKHKSLADTGAGYYYCPDCAYRWTYSEYEEEENEVSDISAEKILYKHILADSEKQMSGDNRLVIKDPPFEEIIKNPTFQMHVAAMEEYASIVNERKDNAGINDAIEFADWINKNASRNAVGSWGYFGNMFYTKTSKELYDIFKSESQPQQKEVDGYDDEMPPL